MKKVVLALIVIAIISMGAWYALVIHKDLDPNKAHGSVDIQDSLLSFERTGKIVSLNVDEGATVRKGDVLARLDSQSLDHQMKIQFAQCRAEQALLSQYQNGYLPEEIASAKAAVNKSQSNVDLASITYDRNASLLRTKSVSKQEYDSARAQYQQAQATLAESKAQLSLLEKGYRQEIISSQEARVTACQEQLAYLNYQIQQQGVIVAPFNGTIRSRTHELSDYVGVGETIFALTDENRKRIRIYLSEDQLRLITTGQKVSVEVPYHAPLAGTISFISPTAMFTPKSVQTEDLRTDLIYEVRIEVVDQQRVLRFGQAITVYLQGTAPDHRSDSDKEADAAAAFAPAAADDAAQNAADTAADVSAAATEEANAAVATPHA